MAGGGLVVQGEVKNYNGKVTFFVIITCMIAATGGLIFGYDIGLSGGVTSMNVFLEKFFPSVYEDQINAGASKNQGCSFDSQLLTAFTSSLYVAGLISTFFASTVTRVLGRKASMLCGGAAFLVGSALNGAAMNVAMLIIGRVLLGVPGRPPLSLRDGPAQTPRSPQHRIPARHHHRHPHRQPRELWNQQDQGRIRVAHLRRARRGSGRHHDRRRPLPARHPQLPDRAGQARNGQEDSPEGEGDRRRRRGAAGHGRGERVGQAGAHPWKKILQRHYRPQLVMALSIPGFQQLTGINIIMFYAPVLFKTIGFGDNVSLMSAVITGLVNVGATVVSIVTVDRFGRKFLFVEGAVQMLISQVAIAAILGVKFGVDGTGVMSKPYADAVLVLICTYVALFAWSWGPLGWLVPSEIFPLEIRSAGQSIVVCVNFLWTFIIAQFFLMALCHVKFGLFLLFAFFVVVMTLFVILLLPETKNVPIEEMNLVWKKHWYWKNYSPDDHMAVA